MQLNTFQIHLSRMAVLSQTLAFSTLALGGPLDLYNNQGNLLSPEQLQTVESDAKVQREKDLEVDPKLAAKADPKYYAINIQTYTGLDSYSPEMYDVTRSYMGIVLGSTNYNQFLNDYKEISKQSTVIQFSAKFSLVPTILRGYVQGQVNNEIDAKAEAARAQYTAAAAVKIHQQVSALVSAGKISSQQGDLMAAKFIQSAKVQIDSQVEMARQKSRDTVENRLDTIQTELTFQEVCVKIAQRVVQNDDGAFLIFGSVGKAAVDGGLGPNQGLLNVAPLAWWGPRGMTTQGTGMVQAGLEWVSKNNLKLGTEVYFFHDRIPTISGNRGLTNMIYMSDAAFDNQREFWKIDSNMEKFYVKFPSTVAKAENQFYFTTADFNGSTRRSYGGGALIRVTPTISFQVDSTFNRPGFDHVITESIQYQATDKLTFYLVNENIKGGKSRYDRDPSYSSFNLGSAGIGVTYRLVDVLVIGIHTTLDVNAECRGFYERTHSVIKDDFGCGGGVMINAQY